MNFLVVTKKICYTINMKILIPTAKEMNTDLPSIEAAPLKPESQAVLDALALYSASQLESFYKVSAEKAAEEFQNIQDLKRQTAQHYPALNLFDGLMYRHIKRDKLTEVEQAYLENHVFYYFGFVRSRSSLVTDVTAPFGLFDEIKGRW